ncbi:hypothetical protein [Wolbachia endosymbiont of Armadillidium arcangelii]|uniref:Uncharacterized protein n=2 Tax=unclassified Wolbachia TaxID=2640676 RepID=A0AAU7Q213_9RICK
MGQKEVTPNLMVNPFEQSCIRLRKKPMLELSLRGICEKRLNTHRPKWYEII